MLPLAALAAIGGGAGLLTKGLPYIVGALSPEGQAEAAQAKADIEALKRNEFGPTKSQQERAVQDAVAMARASAQADKAEANRAAAAQSYRGPDTTKLKIAETAAKQAGTLRMGAADQAAQLGAQAKRDALSRIGARRKETEAALADTLGGATQGATAALAAGAGGGGLDYGVLAGGLNPAVAAAQKAKAEAEAAKKAAAGGA